ncbi:DUF3566 domain-containing protein [Rhodococcus erythropolis]|uniref:DUF3566 domain-containing protein n=1 Tax=Rhodococcus sp. TaxID=1831 RepID=UPI001A294C16|nr:DUF3566 domain-containing protein [Rhodococcus sp. (in: high G+C Gram-positive bacteria)]MBJ7478548.1 DUF3566 domain-containing protein [Rhodococcus sp. (in: high G+C Gram-positive bacteria)]
MSTPNQPGSDRKSESPSGQVPPKPEQATAPAGPQTSKPAAPADGGPKASEAAPAPKAPEPPRGPSDSAQKPAAAAPEAAGAAKGQAPSAPSVAPAAPVTPAKGDGQAPPQPVANQARGSQAPPWQRGPQPSGQPQGQPSQAPKAPAQNPSAQNPAVQNPVKAPAPQNQVPQSQPQTNITRPAGAGAPAGRPAAPAGGKPPTGPQRPAAAGPAQGGQAKSPAPKGQPQSGRPAGAQPARPVVTGTAAAAATGGIAGAAAAKSNAPTVAAKAVAPAGADPRAANPKAKAAAIDGPTRHIDRKDLPKDMPDLSEAKHPLPAAVKGEKTHAGPASVVDGAPLRATVQIRRIDPWSTLKITSVISVSLFFVWMVAVGLLYVVLDGMGVWDRLNNAFTDIVADGGSDGLVTAGQVFGYAALIGIANMVLFTALVTIGSFIYNLCSDLVGGVEVTLADRD